MPNQPKTPARAVRISDDLWEAAQEVAAADGETVSDLVRSGLERELRRRAARDARRRHSVDA